MWTGIQLNLLGCQGTSQYPDDFLHHQKVENKLQPPSQVVRRLGPCCTPHNPSPFINRPSAVRWEVTSILGELRCQGLYACCAGKLGGKKISLKFLLVTSGLAHFKNCLFMQQWRHAFHKNEWRTSVFQFSLPMAGKPSRMHSSPLYSSCHLFPENRSQLNAKEDRDPIQRGSGEQERENGAIEFVRQRTAVK